MKEFHITQQPIKISLGHIVKHSYSQEYTPHQPGLVLDMEQGKHLGSDFPSFLVIAGRVPQQEMA